MSAPPASLTVAFWRIVFAGYGYDEIRVLQEIAAAGRLTRKEGEA